MDIYPSSDETDSDEEEYDNTSFKFEFPVDSTNSERTNDNNMKYIEWTQSIPNELVPLVYECLSSNKKNEIQNELVELLGFDKLDTVEFLLSNREAVVNAYKVYLQDLDQAGSKRKYFPKGTNNSACAAGSKKPAIATEITVHTETEKRIKKQILKEEKRLRQLKNANEQTALEEEFDPTILRKVREEQLSEARLFQLYSQKKLDSLTPDSIIRLFDL
jgi:hypothetical protein